MTGRGAAAGVRLAQRTINRLGMHLDLQPAQLPATVRRARTAVREAEQALVATLQVGMGEPIDEGRHVTVEWFAQVMVPADIWMTHWARWQPLAALHPRTVALRCCAWVELGSDPIPEPDPPE